MPLSVACPNQHRLKVDEKYIGRTIRCPKCSASFAVEAPPNDVEVVAAQPIKPEQPPANDPFGIGTTDPFAASPGASDHDPFGLAALPPVQAAGSNQFTSPTFSNAPAVKPQSGNSKEKSPKSAAQAKPTPQSSRRDRDKPLDSAKYVPWVVGGAAVLFGLVFVGGIGAYLAMSSGTDINSGQELVESKVLMTLVEQEFSGRNSDDREQAVALKLSELRELYPEFLQVPQWMEERLNEPDALRDSITKRDAIVKALREICHEIVDIDKKNISAADVEYQAQRFMVEWRRNLRFAGNQTNDSWMEIKEVERNLFGNQSVFNKVRQYDQDNLEELFELCEQLQKLQTALVQYVAANELKMPNAVEKSQSKLGWRVAMLPSLGEEELYNEFHHNEPWDSKHNKELLSRMPPIFDTPGLLRQGKTTIHLVHSARSFGYSGKLSKNNLDDEDFYCTPIFIVGEDATAEEWTKPDNIFFDERDGPAKLSNPKYLLFISGDGIVRMVPDGESVEAFQELITVGDGVPHEAAFAKRYPDFKKTVMPCVELIRNVRKINPIKMK